MSMEWRPYGRIKSSNGTELEIRTTKVADLASGVPNNGPVLHRTPTGYLHSPSPSSSQTHRHHSLPFPPPPTALQNHHHDPFNYHHQQQYKSTSLFKPIASTRPATQSNTKSRNHISDLIEGVGLRWSLWIGKMHRWSPSSETAQAIHTPRRCERRSFVWKLPKYGSRDGFESLETLGSSAKVRRCEEHGPNGGRSRQRRRNLLGLGEEVSEFWIDGVAQRTRLIRETSHQWRLKPLETKKEMPRKQGFIGEPPNPADTRISILTKKHCGGGSVRFSDLTMKHCGGSTHFSGPMPMNRTTHELWLLPMPTFTILHEQGEAEGKQTLLPN